MRLPQCFHPDAPEGMAAEPAQGVSSVRTVKKTSGVKSPREIELEKALSRAENRIDALETAVSGVNEFLADAFPTSKVKPTAGPPVSKPVSKGIFGEIEDFLEGN